MKKSIKDAATEAFYGDNEIPRGANYLHGYEGQFVAGDAHGYARALEEASEELTKLKAENEMMRDRVYDLEKQVIIELKEENEVLKRELDLCYSREENVVRTVDGTFLQLAQSVRHQLSDRREEFNRKIDENKKGHGQ